MLLRDDAMECPFFDRKLGVRRFFCFFDSDRLVTFRCKDSDKA
jgi:hypothetical protein